MLYRRSGNFRVKYISPFNFLRCFIIVARAHRRKLNHAKILFTRTRSVFTCTFLGPDTMLRHWREGGASDQRERGNAADTHAVSLIERELPLATYLERFTRLSRSAVPTAFRSSLPQSRAWAGIEELSDLQRSGTPSAGFW